MGRFINADGYASTGQGILGYNMFSYCRNSVVSLIDKAGSLSNTCTLVADTGSPILINGQNTIPYKNKEFGASTIGYAGCEVIATYNALRLIGIHISFDEVKSEYEQMLKQGAGLCLNGRWGLLPWDINKYLSRAGVEYQGCNLEQMKSITEPGAMIITYWNAPFTTGIHTIAISFDGNNYWAYNQYTQSNTRTPGTIETFITNNRRYFYGFYLPYS